MDIKNALDEILVEELAINETLMKLPAKDQETLREYGRHVCGTAVEGNASVTAIFFLGFALGHNFVKKYWTLW